MNNSDIEIIPPGKVLNLFLPWYVNEIGSPN